MDTNSASLRARRASWPREGKSEEKSGEKNRGGDITPMRLRRSLFFVAPATPAGTPSRRKPGESIKALPGRPGCGLPGAPRLPRPKRVRLAEEKVEKSRTGCAGAAGGRASAQAHRGRVFLANPGSECPFGSPWVRKGRTTENRRPNRRARRPVAAFLRVVARHGAAMARHGRDIAPEQVSAHRQPFSVGLTTSAVGRSSRRPPASFRCGERKMNPC